jgi:O-antigen ligase
MDNYAIYSNREKATHNAYTQVSVELGLPALLAYLTFLITTVKRLRVTSRASVGLKRRPPHFYLALGLEASLLGYMVTSFFASVAFLWYVYYVVAYAIVLTRIKPDVEYNLK